MNNHKKNEETLGMASRNMYVVIETPCMASLLFILPVDKIE